MSRQSFADALELFERAVVGLDPVARDDVRGLVAAWAAASGAVVQEHADVLVVRLRRGDSDVTLRLHIQVVSDGSSEPDPVDSASVADLAAALNQGLLRHEIDAAVGAEPELAV